MCQGRTLQPKTGVQSFDRDSMVDSVESRREVKQYQDIITVIIKGQNYVIRNTQQGSLSNRSMIRGHFEG